MTMMRRRARTTKERIAMVKKMKNQKRTLGKQQVKEGNDVKEEEEIVERKH